MNKIRLYTLFPGGSIVGPLYINLSSGNSYLLLDTGKLTCLEDGSWQVTFSGYEEASRYVSYFSGKGENSSETNHVNEDLMPRHWSINDDGTSIWFTTTEFTTVDIVTDESPGDYRDYDILEIITPWVESLIVRSQHTLEQEQFKLAMMLDQGVLKSREPMADYLSPEMRFYVITYPESWVTSAYIAHVFGITKDYIDYLADVTFDEDTPDNFIFKLKERARDIIAEAPDELKAPVNTERPKLKTFKELNNKIPK